ncbi:MULTISPECIES: hypothetical protein [unclassified Pseudomonas]|uniref:hypothetical protein n=1 Tax=unclassified Pseudomonas TaxID=196821 RepID=UPI000C88A3FD|nr:MULTISPECIES: hypothetical protein [unclassified Pseudomonas]PMZ85272.1 hypothetical protein C1X61_28235 [Pseudomonas sp. FW215-T2]PNA08307.1 hypothetical protein C1X62_25870 [Pseudomonas sp. FW215-R3]PNB34437.1 hypothetical protein C1X63_27200 [Pseudomonas sp. FW305-131]
MNLKEELTNITTGYAAETIRTRLLVKFVESSAKKKAEETIEMHSTIQKLLSGELAHKKKHPQDRSTIEVPTKLLIDLASPLEKTGKDLLSLPELCLRMAYVHLVTLFEAALSDIIRTTLTYKPNILKSKRQISYEDVLSEPDMTSLLLKIIDKEISDMTYGSTEETIDYLQNKLHLPVTFSDEEHLELETIKAQRNLLVHNQGKIDAKYLKKKISGDFSLGDNIIITEKDWDAANLLFGGIINSLELAIIRKFKLT